MSMQEDISVLYPAQCILGESPLWHEKRKSYIWVDIEEKRLYELHSITKRFKQWQFDKRVSVALENEDSGVVLGMQGGIAGFNFKKGRTKWLVDIEPGLKDNRCNDGACDYMGRVWIGTMDTACKEGAGSLFYLNTRLQIKKKISGITIPNGIAWSANNEIMYFVDTTARVIKSFAFDSISGEISDERIAINIPPGIGMPDGMAMDEEGMLWIAMYGGSCISRWDPLAGELIQTIPLPVPHITNCCFAGEGLDQLLITTARENLSKEELKKYPQSGDVFIIKKMAVKGVKLHKAFYDQ